MTYFFRNKVCKKHVKQRSIQLYSRTNLTTKKIFEFIDGSYEIDLTEKNRPDPTNVQM